MFQGRIAARTASPLEIRVRRPTPQVAGQPVDRERGQSSSEGRDGSLAGFWGAQPFAPVAEVRRTPPPQTEAPKATRTSQSCSAPPDRSPLTPGRVPGRAVGIRLTPHASTRSSALIAAGYRPWSRPSAGRNVRETIGTPRETGRAVLSYDGPPVAGRTAVAADARSWRVHVHQRRRGHGLHQGSGRASSSTSGSVTCPGSCSTSTCRLRRWVRSSSPRARCSTARRSAASRRSTSPT